MHRVSGGRIDTFHGEKFPILLPGQSVVWRFGQIAIVNNKIFWRLEIDFADMSLDQHVRRWRSSLYSDQGHEDMPNLVGICSTRGQLITLHSGEDSSFHLRSNEHVLAEHSGIAVSLLSTSDSIIVLGESFAYFFSISNAFEVSLSKTVSLPTSCLRPRINPNLNVYRKFSQLQTPLSVAVGIQNLPINASPALPRVPLGRPPRWTRSYVKDGEIVFGTETDLFRIRDDLVLTEMKSDISRIMSLNELGFVQNGIFLFTLFNSAKLIILNEQDSDFVGESNMKEVPRYDDILDATCYTNADGVILIGTFDGEIYQSNESETKLLISTKFIINKISVYSEYILVGTRSGDLLVIEEGKIIFEKKIGILKINILEFRSNLFLIFCESVFLFNINTFEVMNVPLGTTKRISELEILNEETIKIFFEWKKSVTFSIIPQKFVLYEKNLGFRPEIFLPGSAIGQVEKTGQKALFKLDIDLGRIGALINSNALDPIETGVSAVLPFNSIKEEPVCLVHWAHELFPEGLVVVGTKGKTKGRLLIFDDSLIPLAKTAIPSTQVAAICVVSNSILAVGSTDCVALIGLRPGGLPFTIATFSTYILVKHITAVSETEVLVVTSNGVVTLLALTEGTVLSSKAQLDSPRRISSICAIMPNKRQFVCSDSDGVLLRYNIDSSETGVMSLAENWDMHGATLSSTCTKEESLILGFSNGALNILGPEELKINIATRTLSSSS